MLWTTLRKRLQSIGVSVTETTPEIRIAVVIVTAIAWAYVRYGALPELTGVLYGIKPVIVAVVVQALWGLGRTAVKLSKAGKHFYDYHFMSLGMAEYRSGNDAAAEEFGFLRNAVVQETSQVWRETARPQHG